MPSEVQPGDTMLLTLARSSSATWNSPIGWTQVDTSTTGTLNTTVWVKGATADDLGTKVTLTTGAYTHASLSLAVYRGVDATTPVDAVSHTGDASKTSHTTSTVSAESSDWLVSIWSSRTTAPVSWTLPAAVTSRDSSPDSGNPSIQVVTADSGGGVSAGTSGGLTATTSIATTAVMVTITLKPA